MKRTILVLTTVITLIISNVVSATEDDKCMILQKKQENTKLRIETLKEQRAKLMPRRSVKEYAEEYRAIRDEIMHLLNVLEELEWQIDEECLKMPITKNDTTDITSLKMELEEIKAKIRPLDDRKVGLDYYLRTEEERKKDAEYQDILKQLKPLELQKKKLEDQIERASSTPLTVTECDAIKDEIVKTDAKLQSIEGEMWKTKIEKQRPSRIWEAYHRSQALQQRRSRLRHHKDELKQILKKRCQHPKQ